MCNQEQLHWLQKMSQFRKISNLLSTPIVCMGFPLQQECYFQFYPLFFNYILLLVKMYPHCFFVFVQVHVFLESVVIPAFYNTDVQAAVTWKPVTYAAFLLLLLALVSEHTDNQTPCSSDFPCALFTNKVDRVFSSLYFACSHLFKKEKYLAYRPRSKQKTCTHTHTNCVVRSYVLTKEELFYN